jgi:hypothetical protein
VKRIGGQSDFKWWPIIAIAVIVVIASMWYRDHPHRPGFDQCVKRTHNAAACRRGTRP